MDTDFVFLRRILYEGSEILPFRIFHFRNREWRSLDLFHSNIRTLKFLTDDFKLISMILIIFINLIIIKILRFRDIIRERTFIGYHTFCIKIILKFRTIIFIISELFFLISFFVWTFFHRSTCLATLHRCDFIISTLYEIGSW